MRHEGLTKNLWVDKAWPEYNPYQAQRDVVAVAAELRVLRLWLKAGGPCGIELREARMPTRREPSRRSDWCSFTARLVAGVLVPFVGLPSRCIRLSQWLLVALVIGGAVYLCQQLLTLDTGRWTAA